MDQQQAKDNATISAVAERLKDLGDSLNDQEVQKELQEQVLRLKEHLVAKGVVIRGLENENITLEEHISNAAALKAELQKWVTSYQGYLQLPSFFDDSKQLGTNNAINHRRLQMAALQDATHPEAVMCG